MPTFLTLWAAQHKHHTTKSHTAHSASFRGCGKGEPRDQLASRAWRSPVLSQPSRRRSFYDSQPQQWSFAPCLKSHSSGLALPLWLWKLTSNFDVGGISYKQVCNINQIQTRHSLCPPQTSATDLREIRTANRRVRESYLQEVRSDTSAPSPSHTNTHLLPYQNMQSSNPMAVRIYCKRQLLGCSDGEASGDAPGNEEAQRIYCRWPARSFSWCYWQ